MITMGASAHYHDHLKSIDLREFDTISVAGPSLLGSTVIHS